MSSSRSAHLSQVSLALRYYQAEEELDSFHSELPKAKQIMEKVEPPVVEQDLWANYKKKPTRPVYGG